MFEFLEFKNPIETWKYFIQNLGTFKAHTNLIIKTGWNNDFIEAMSGFRDGKKEKRLEKYINPEEFTRFRNSVAHISSSSSAGKIFRFGHHKEGNEFCLAAGIYYPKRKAFYVFYRSVEMSLELMFDFWMFDYLFLQSDIRVNTLVLICPQIMISNRPGRMNYVRKLKNILLPEDSKHEPIRKK